MDPYIGGPKPRLPLMFRRVGLLFVQKEVSYYGDFGSKFVAEVYLIVKR